MSWLPSFSPGLDADILLSGEDERKIMEVKGEKEGRRETCPVYYDGESVKGQVSLVSKCRSCFYKLFYLVSQERIADLSTMQPFAMARTGRHPSEGWKSSQARWHQGRVRWQYRCE